MNEFFQHADSGSRWYDMLAMVEAESRESQRGDHRASTEALVRKISQ
jgi:hypothetical protein